jgi:hypothetical protein
LPTVKDLREAAGEAGGAKRPRYKVPDKALETMGRTTAWLATQDRAANLLASQRAILDQGVQKAVASFAQLEAKRVKDFMALNALAARPPMVNALAAIRKNLAVSVAPMTTHNWEQQRYIPSIVNPTWEHERRVEQGTVAIAQGVSKLAELTAESVQEVRDLRESFEASDSRARRRDWWTIGLTALTAAAAIAAVVIALIR